MSEATEAVIEDQQSGLSEDEQRELDEMMAGYQGRGTTPPPDDQQASNADQQQAAAGDDQGNQQQGNDQQEQNQQDDQQQASAEAPDQVLAKRLDELRAEVRALAANGGAESVRKLHGEIGDINRTLKQMATQTAAAPAAAQEAPADDPFAAAMKKAEDAAREFPELAGPLVDALKLVGDQRSTASKPAMSAEEISALVTERASEAAAQSVQTAAQDALTEEHPDWQEVRGSAEFKAWVDKQPTEYQNRLWNTWNPAVVSRGLSDYKESTRQQQNAQQQTQVNKQNRLEQAVTPKGVPPAPVKSKLTEDEEILAAYNRGSPRPIYRNRG